MQYICLPACAVDAVGRIALWNRFSEEFFCQSADAVLGREWHSVIRTSSHPECCALCQVRRALRTRQIIHPIDATISVDGLDRRVVVIPISASSSADDAIGFLMLAPEHMPHLRSRARASTVISPTVRALGHDRLVQELTVREREILACIAQGADARKIATQLGISHATARNYVQRILNKLGAHSKAEAVSVALTHNLLAS